MGDVAYMCGENFSVYFSVYWGIRDWDCHFMTRDVRTLFGMTAQSIFELEPLLSVKNHQDKQIFHVDGFKGF